MSSFRFSPAGLSDDQAQAIWDALRQAILEIQNGNASQLRFEELYRNSYTLVLHKHGDMLYDGVTQTVTLNLESVSARVSQATSESLLEIIVAEWDQHKLIMTMIRDILMYLDKTYCKTKDKQPVYDMGLSLFKQKVIRHGSVNSRLKAVLLENVFVERLNEVIDRMLMKNCLSMLVEVGVNSRSVYAEEFETAFLEKTRTFYQQESQEFMSRNTVPDYLRKVEERIGEEMSRADAYLDKSTREPLREVVNSELIVKYATNLVENESSGCVAMLKQNLRDDLSRMYRLFKPAGCLQHMRACMSTLVKEAGTAIVQDTENVKNPKQFVQQVLDCRSKYHSIVEDCFQSDKSFVRALKESLEHFINLDSRAAQYLSLYIDDMLKLGLKGVPQQEVENRLNNVISIFRYLHDKDIFEDFYKQHLASRLLSQQSGNDEVEKLMISKLKAECGHQFTSRLEGMFKDMELSKEMMISFGRHIDGLRESKSNVPESELSVTVLTTGFWPVPNAPACHLPKEAQLCQKVFADFFQNKHSGRKLTWQTTLGSAELRCQFEKGRRELVVHTYQMCILMLYNNADSYTYEQIQQITGIPEQELQRHVLSLAHPKVRVLRKEPNTKQLAPDHRFAYNTKYVNKLFRVKIKLLAASAVRSSQPTVPPGVIEARKNRVEAAIVRVMKSRKTLDHNNLVTEVVKQLTSRFAVEPSFIKKRIESLIEREYLERDPNDRRMYKYLA